MERPALFRTFSRAMATALVLFLGVASNSISLLAGPPFFTDDPQPLDNHHWEFYLASQQARSSAAVSGTAPHFEVNYGLGPDLMVHLIAPLSFNKQHDRPLSYGLGDIELGLKYRFIRETKEGPQLGTFPHVELPTGDSRRGLGNGRPQLFIPLWVQKSWGPWTSYCGGGYWINPGPGQKNYWYFGGVTQRQVTQKLTVGGELFGTTSQAIGQSGQTGFNLAVIVGLNAEQQILVSAGRDLHGPNTLFLYIAYYMTIGPHD